MIKVEQKRELRINTVSGNEFLAKNKYIRAVLIDKYKMNVYTMSGRTKGSIVERFNRTLKSRLERYFTESKSQRWVDVLPEMTRNINNTVNQSTGFKPSEVTKANSEEVKARLYPPPMNPQKCNLQIGDRVRIVKEKISSKKATSKVRRTHFIGLNKSFFRLV